MSNASRPQSPNPAPSTTSNSNNKHPLLASGPLYAFSLPRELLSLLSLRSPLGGVAQPAAGQLEQVAAAATDNDEEEDEQHDSNSIVNVSGSGNAMSCHLCKASSFESIQDQRSHFASDWHRYNVKRKMENRSTVDENQWKELVDSLGDSLDNDGTTASSSSSSSGSSDEYSSSESEEESGGNASTLSRVLAKQRISSSSRHKDGGQEDDDSEQLDFTAPRSPILWFEATSLLPDTQLGIYRTIFPSAHKKATTVPWLEDLRRLQVTEDTSRLGKRFQVSDSPPTDPTTRTWTLLAVGGGHFAGMVVSLVPKINNKGNSRLEREVQILSSKTFHRYTTRRKQGGSQSLNDESKGKAKSAGAQIRRYNEAMLRDEIRELLNSWRDLVNKSELVFLRASKASQRIFYDYDDPVLTRKDPRMRTFPFPTRRPTQLELVRCFTELTRIKLSHLTSEELKALDEAYRASLQPKKPLPSSSTQKEKVKVEDVPKLSKEELLQRDKWERVVDMAKRGRVDALRGFVEKQAMAVEEEGEKGVSSWLGALPSWMPESRTTPTLLHVASSSNSEEAPSLVSYLLLEARVDPTLSSIPSPPEGHNNTIPPRTAYEVSSSRAIRNVFRRAFDEHPTWWEWKEGARVPSPLSEEQESSQNLKTKERKKTLKDKIKERQNERAAEEALVAEQEKIKSAQEEEKKRLERISDERKIPRKLGGAAPLKVQEQTSMKGLSEEQKMRIERERRAKAAEERLKGRSDITRFKHPQHDF